MIVIFSTILCSFATNAADGAVVTVVSKNVEAGASVSVPIVLTGNPGIEGMQLFIEYDKELTLLNAARGDALKSLDFIASGDYSVYPFSVLWDGLSDDTTNGTLVTLTFQTKNSANGIYSIRVYTQEENIYNDNNDNVPVTFAGGSVTIADAVETSKPTVVPTASPTTTPTASPTVTPTIKPTEMPVETVIPTSKPSESPVPSTEPTELKAKIKVGEVLTKPGKDVKIPIILEDNPGIMGMQLNIEYSDELKLKSVEKGDALSSLSYTQSGSIRTYPFVVLWDGLSNDSSNGTLVYLTFQAPTLEGEYNVKVQADNGATYNFDMEDILLVFEDGIISVSKDAPNEDITLSNVNFSSDENRVNISANITNNTKTQQNMDIVVAMYRQGKLVEIKVISENVGAENSKHITTYLLDTENFDETVIYVWDSVKGMKPLCDKYSEVGLHTE